MMLNIVFYSTLFLSVYCYFLFPLILFVVVKIKTIYQNNSRRPQRQSADMESPKCSPQVAVLCAMYNEDKVAHSKIKNFLELNYERAKLYIGSDGSSDQTNAILREYANNSKIVCYEFDRRGKVHVLNNLISRVQEEIVVFTDANSMFESDAISRLIEQLNSPSIGAVCGKLTLVNSGQLTGEGFYWKYETMIKKLESDLNCVMGANGAIYAVKKKLLALLPSNTINDDFTITMRVIEQGYGVKYAEDAIAYEETNHDDAVEFKRHVRDGAGHYRAIIHLFKLLNPVRFKVFFLYISHRIIRWLVPFFLLIMLILPIFMELSPLLKIIFSLEIAVYILVALGWVFEIRKKLVYYPFYFVYINVALLLGFWKTVLGIQRVTWNSTER